MKLIGVLAIVSLILIPSVASANLLTNPGFESGLTGWTWGYRPFEVVTSPVHGGDYATRNLVTAVATEDWYAINYQEFAWTAGTPFYADLWIQSAFDPTAVATAKLIVEGYDSGGYLTGAAEWGTTGSPGVYQHGSVSGTAWTDTTKLRFNSVVWAQKDSAAAVGGKAYFDDAYLDTTPIPEPSSLILMFTGLAGLFGLSARRKR